MALSLKWIPRLIRWRDPTRKGTQEASDQYMGKSAKLATFNDLTMAVDLKEIAEEDREGVAALRKKHGMGFTSKGAGDKDAWVCDDMTINASRSGVMELLVGLLLGALAFWFFGSKLQGQTPTPDTPVAVDDTEYEVRFYDKDGNQITVPRYTPAAKD